MTTIRKETIDHLKNILPDCKNCIHYWNKNGKEICTSEKAEDTYFPDIACGYYESEEYEFKKDKEL